MAHAILSVSHLAAFANANVSYDPAATKKRLWAEVRALFNVPTEVKLGFENDLDDPMCGHLYVKGTEPRVYLNDDGTLDRSSQSGNEPSTPATPVPSNTPAQTQPTGFMVSDSPGEACWFSISKEDLLAALRDGDDPEAFSEPVHTLPAGFPTNLGKDALVMGRDGTIYFRKD